MELRVLQYFLAVAREQSFSGAAQSLHLSQPTLSTQLKALEEELGKQLFVRGSKGSRKVTLTGEGMILRKRAEEILDLVHKAETEIALSDDAVAGDVYIGLGETEIVRWIARAAKAMRTQYPDIHFHIASGNADFVMEQLDKGLIDFGLLYTAVDPAKYNSVTLPMRDVWGVLMRRDSELAEKSEIAPEDLWDKPLILSEQHNNRAGVLRWLRRDVQKLNVAATYNLVYNASLLVDEGLGYAICFDKLVNTQNCSLCFRPLQPRLEATAYLAWKKYSVFSKAVERFMQTLRETLPTE